MIGQRESCQYLRNDSRTNKGIQFYQAAVPCKEMDQAITDGKVVTWARLTSMLTMVR